MNCWTKITLLCIFHYSNCQKCHASVHQWSSSAEVHRYQNSHTIDIFCTKISLIPLFYSFNMFVGKRLALLLCIELPAASEWSAVTDAWVDDTPHDSSVHHLRVLKVHWHRVCQSTFFCIIYHNTSHILLIIFVNQSHINPISCPVVYSRFLNCLLLNVVFLSFCSFYGKLADMIILY